MLHVGTGEECHIQASDFGRIVETRVAEDLLFGRGMCVLVLTQPYTTRNSALREEARRRPCEAWGEARPDRVLRMFGVGGEARTNAGCHPRCRRRRFDARIV